MWKINNYNKNFIAVVSDSNDEKNSIFIISDDEATCSLAGIDVMNFMNRGKRTERLKVFDNIGNEYFVFKGFRAGIMSPPKDPSWRGSNSERLEFGKEFYKRLAK